jgi:hypothetical protein
MTLVALGVVLLIIGVILFWYRAYRYPYDWISQLDKPEERALPRLDNSAFRIPGAPGKRARNVTRIKK